MTRTRRRRGLQRSFTVAATGGGSGNPVTFSSARRLLEHRRDVHDDERHRHLLGQVRPGRRRELQRGPAGDAESVDRAEGRPDDHRPAIARLARTRGYNDALGDRRAPGTRSPSASGPGVCIEHRQHVHDDERQRHLHRQVRPGRDANYNAAPQVPRRSTRRRPTRRSPSPRTLRRRAVYNTSFSVAATGGASGNAGHVLQRRRLLEHRRHLHDDERHRHLHRPVRPGRRRELQRRPAGDRDGRRAEGRPDDQRHHARAGDAPSSARASRSRRGGGSGGAVTFSSARRLLEHRRHVHDDERHRHLHRQVRPGRRRQLQPRAAGDRDGHGAEGRPDDQRHARTRRPRAVFGTSFTVAATGGGSGNPVTFSSSGACSNTGATFTMTSGTGTCRSSTTRPATRTTTPRRR